MNRLVGGWSGLIRLRTLAGLMLLATCLSIVSGQGTLAYFTSAATSAGNHFTAGTLELRLSDTDETDLASVTGSIGTTTFRPGDLVAGYVTVRNTGTLPFDYGLRFSATNTAGTLWLGGVSSPYLFVFSADAVANCTTANIWEGEVGLTLINTVSVGTTPDTVVFDSGVGSRRSVAVSSSETLCLAVYWTDGAAGDEYAQMGAQGAITLTFDAR